MGLSGHGVTAADSLALTGTYKGWINLCTTTSDDQCPHEALQKAGIVFKRVPVEVCALYLNPSGKFPSRSFPALHPRRTASPRAPASEPSPPPPDMRSG
jgi:hypothetical protein